MDAVTVLRQVDPHRSDRIVGPGGHHDLPVTAVVAEFGRIVGVVRLGRDAEDRPIESDRRYALLPGRGFLATDAAEDGGYAGATLRDIADERYDSARTLAEAKRLTRSLLARHLEGHVLKTRQILVDLQKL